MAKKKEPKFITPFNYKPNKKFEKHIEEEVVDYIKVIDEETKEITLEANGKTNVKEMIQAELPNVMKLGESVEMFEDGLRPKGGFEAAQYGDFTKEPITKAQARRAMLDTKDAQYQIEKICPIQQSKGEQSIWQQQVLIQY